MSLGRQLTTPCHDLGEVARQDLQEAPEVCTIILGDTVLYIFIIYHIDWYIYIYIDIPIFMGFYSGLMGFIVI